MSTNGDIEIAVSAEGADEAAAQLGGDGDGGGPAVTGGGGGGGGDGGGLRGNLKSGAIAGALLSALGPLIDVVSPILDLLKAFLAPVAILLLRLMQPFLRVMLTDILPAWMEFMDGALSWAADLADRFGAFAGLLVPLAPLLLALEELGIDSVDWLASVTGFVQSLPGDIWQAIIGGAAWLAAGPTMIGGAVWNAVSGWASNLREDIGSLPQQIWSYVQQLPSQIATALSGALPGGNGGSGGLFGGVPVLGGGGGSDGGGDGGGDLSDINVGGGTSVTLTGGLATFVENIERSSQVDL